MDFNFNRALETLTKSRDIGDTAKTLLKSTISELEKNGVLFENVSDLFFYTRNTITGIKLKSCYSTKDNHAILRELCSIDITLDWDFNQAISTIKTIETEFKNRNSEVRCINFNNMLDIYELTCRSDLSKPEGFKIML